MYSARYEFPIARMAKVLKVSESGYYKWLKRLFAPPTKREVEDLELAKEIYELFWRYHGIFGARKITSLLNKGRENPVNHKRVERLMGEYGLVSKVRLKYIHTTDSKHDEPVAANLLQRNFSANRPNEKMVSDTTAVATKQGVLYAAAILDLYGRYPVGLSGAGKSTIVNLLDKFYHPDCGTIRLDGVELKDWDTQWLRDNVGLVLQKNHIFDGSIEDNIKYGNPQATHDDVVKAARQAYLYDQVMQLPQGFQTSALQLSGGQQQRVAIARMFIKNPPVIFLDEPTASLDAIATEQIKASIDAIKQGRTVIIISHNIGQIIDADQIYVLQQGRVVQSGTPTEVYRQGGLYKDIFDASARSMNVDKIASVTSA